MNTFLTESTVNDNTHLRLVKWPFYIGDGLLVLLAFLILFFSEPLSSTAISWCVISITFGALLFVAPFILEYLNSVRLAKNHLQETVDKQLQSLGTVLQELDVHSSALSDLAQKSANSTENIDKVGPELKTQLKESCDKIDSLLDNAQGKDSIDESLSEVLKQRLESIENKVSELVSLQTIKTVSEDNETKIPEIEADPNLVNLDSTPIDVTDNSLNEAVESQDFVESPDPSGDLEETIQDAKEMSVFVTENGNSITLVAHLNIDISSTPFVRGEGAGLSWDEGVPMEFIEIGKWEWKIENATETASCRIFKDDSLAAKGDDIVINVGEKAEVYPEFPEE